MQSSRKTSKRASIFGRLLSVPPRRRTPRSVSRPPSFQYTVELVEDPVLEDSPSEMASGWLENWRAAGAIHRSAPLLV